MTTREESILLDSFELKIRDITSVELDRLHALSIGVSWPHRAEDWQMLRETGRGIAALDEIERVLGSAMWFPYTEDFASVGMVITSPRLQAQGAARWLMDRVLAETGDRPLGLNATRAAHQLYRSMGFIAEATVYQCQSVANPPPSAPLPAGASLHGVEKGDLPALAALDRDAYGADRTTLLGHLLAKSSGVALSRRGRIAAFALCRRFGRGHVVGPVVAGNDADAIAVTRPHVADHAGRFLRLDTRQNGGAFFQFLTRSGLSVFDTVTTMSLRQRWTMHEPTAEGTRPTTYALVSQALG
jgi:GNAT superfamily N-acetyltransferase